MRGFERLDLPTFVPAEVAGVWRVDAQYDGVSRFRSRQRFRTQEQAQAFADRLNSGEADARQTQ